MASNFPQFDNQDRQTHEKSLMLIAQMTANRDQLEAFHRDAKGRRKKQYEEHLATADRNLFEFRSSHEVFAGHLIERGVIPESQRPRPVLENDTRTNAEKMGLPESSPVFGRPLDTGAHETQPSGVDGDPWPYPETKVPNGKSLPMGTPDPAPGVTPGTPSHGKADPTGRHASSSQAGLSAHAGGQAKSLPSVPTPGESGSRFNPRDVTREEQAARRDSTESSPGAAEKVAKKSLNIGTQRALVEGVPEILKTETGGNPDQGITGAAAKGFARGALSGVEMNMRTKDQSGPSADQGQTAERSAPKAPRTAGPVRNSSGQTLREASAPVEDALPGTTQPFALDAIDAIQGKSPKVQGDPPKTVAMNPEHVAALETLDGQRDEGLGRGDDGYGRR